VITRDIAHFLYDLHHGNTGIEIHGLLEAGEEPCLRVVEGLA
jgi:hypothetical protein